MLNFATSFKVMKKFFKFLFIKLPLALIALSVLLVVIFKWVPVWVTPIMVHRSIQYRNDPDYHTSKKWVKLEDISPEMMKAVISSEDNLFCKHNGFDEKAIRQAIEERKAGKRIRGGSTISQQTAKNMFTLHGRTWWRKGVESWFTILIELFWSKERIMEVYLNIVETGKGVFGVEAASQKYFHKSAAKLTRREACLIAAVLPSPLKRNAGKPSSYVSSRATAIARLVPKLAYPDWITGKKSD